MIRNLKTLGFALCAIFATSGLSASAASAATDVFTVEGQGNALLTGVSHDTRFAIGNSKFECTTKKIAATVSNNATTITVDVEYSGIINQTPHTNPKCTASIGEVTVDTNGCHYKWTGSTTGEHPGVAGKDATIWIDCLEAPMQTTGPGGVTITVPSQTPTVGGVSYTNLPNHPDKAAIKVTTTLTGITFNCHPAFTCALGGIPSHGNNTTTIGTVMLTGYVDKEGLPTPIEEGNRVGVSYHEV